MKIRNMILLALVGLLLTCVAGCPVDEKSADQKQAEATERLMQEANSKCDLPRIKNFQEKKNAKLIIEECDRADLICYAYRSNLKGQYIFIGRCMGYGLPYSVQYTNPERIAYKSATYGCLTLPQPDPAGLFKPDGLAATWLMLINPEDNKAYPVYIEQEITVSPFPLPGAITSADL